MKVKELKEAIANRPTRCQSVEDDFFDAIDDHDINYHYQGFAEKIEDFFDTIDDLDESQDVDDDLKISIDGCIGRIKCEIYSLKSTISDYKDEISKYEDIQSNLENLLEDYNG